MTITGYRKTHRVLSIVKIALQAATLVTVGVAVHELERIHHRMKKIERKEGRRQL